MTTAMMVAMKNAPVGSDNPNPKVPRTRIAISEAMAGIICVHSAFFACSLVVSFPKIHTRIGNKIGAKKILQ